MHSVADLLTRWPALEVTAKRARLQNTLRLSPGPIASAIERDAASAERAASGLREREPSAWSSDPAVQHKIANRLGWLDSPSLMADARERLERFASSVRQDGFTDVVLLGMGGSSLAPEVLRSILGVAPGWPRLRMVDSTDPDAVRAAATPPRTTLYIIASKSGTTIEPNALAAHFRQSLEAARVERWADHFVAITDEGTALANRARAEKFRDLFINPADIGGRYSALSFFGLVPATLMGQDIGALLGWGLAMLSAADTAQRQMRGNPAVALGLAIGAAGRSGRDKLSLILPRPLAAFGLWVEQLIAESTGKQGIGIVPIVGEPVGRPEEYGSDRFFVALRTATSHRDEREQAAILALKAAHPLVEIDLPEPSALGAEFVRWEIATAIAGALLHINPFDEPNVQQAKDATRKLLDTYTSQGRLPDATADRTLTDGITLTLTRAAREQLANKTPDALLTLAGPNDYVALLAYLAPDRDLEETLTAFRVAIRQRTRSATMFGYGPRYLHSTGQLHKGGPNSGVFILITAAPDADVDVPGEPFSFGTLERAQALGDFSSLDATGRRAVHIHLPAADPRYRNEIIDRMLSALKA